MYRIVLLRHGESTWNKENRFTGWTDVDLSEKGVAEAHRAGAAAQGAGLRLRPGLHLGAQARHPHPVDRAGRDGPDVDPGPQLLAAERAPLRRAAGAEQGRDGREVRRRAGQDLAPQLRHPAAGADGRRPALPRPRPALSRTWRQDVPLTECLKDTVARFLPYWHETIAPAVRAGQRVIIAAHGNSLRALVKYLDNISDDDIVELNIPTGVPLVYELDDELKPISHYYLGDPEEIRKAQEAVAKQGKAKG